MKKTSSRIIVYLSMVGLILPYTTPVAAANRTEIDPAAAAVVDVALTDGILRGQLLDRQGLPKSRAPVTVTSSDRVVRQTASDEQGRFAVQLSRGGIYVLAADDSSTVIRAWTQAAAPPAAKESILLVSGQSLARAQLGSHGFLNDSTLRTAVALAAIGGITTAIIVAVSDDAS